MFDGKAFGQEVVTAVRSHIDRAVSPLLERIAALEKALGLLPAPLPEAAVAEIAERAATAAVAALPVPKDGRDADPVEIERMVASAVRSAVEALPPARDGKDVDPAEVAAIVSAGLADAVAGVKIDLESALTVRMDDAIAALPAAEPGPPGKSVTLEDVAPLIEMAVERAVAALPPAEPGKSVDVAVVEKMVADAVGSAIAALPPPEPGKSIAPSEVEAMVAGHVEKAIAALPVPQPGKDADPAEIAQMVDAAVAKLPPAPPGKDADPAQFAGLVEAEVAKAVAALPPPEPGKSVTVDDVRPLIEAEVARVAAGLPPPKDGVGVAGALIDRDGALVLTLSDGSVKTLGQVVGKDAAPVDLPALIRAEVDQIPRPKDGIDGLGFDDLTIEHDGERGFVFRLSRGEVVKEYAFSIPTMLYRGIYSEGQTYGRGDVVTWAGSGWVAEKETAAKPGLPDSGWKLAVKAGRDAKAPVKI